MRPSIDYLFLFLIATCVAVVLFVSLFTVSSTIGFISGILAFNGCTVLAIYNAAKYFSRSEEEQALPF